MPTNKHPKSLLTKIFCISFILGIYLGPNFNHIPTSLYYALIITLIILIFAKSKIVLYAIILSGLITGITKIQTTILEKNIAHKLTHDQTAKISGTIIYPPENKNNKQQIIITNLHDQYQNYFDNNMLLFTSPFPPYHFLDQIEIESKIVRPENFTEDFSYIGYLSLKNIHYLAYSPKITLLQTYNQFYDSSTNIYQNILFYLYKLRDYLLKIINYSLPYPNSGLLAGLLLGYKNALPTILYDQFRIAGLTHIIVVSGFNLTIFSTLFLKNLRGYLPRLFLFIVAILFILAFTLLTGAESSIVRAFFMSIILLIAPFISRQNQPIIAILLAACLMIFLNPFILWYDAGFHLSFLATLGLVYVSPVLAKITDQIQFMPKIIVSTFTETFSAMITTTPYIITSFHQISLVAIISNILVLPVIPFAMTFGSISIICTFIPFLSPLANLITNTLLGYIIYIGQSITRLPFAAINISIPKYYLLIFYPILIIFIYVFWTKQTSKK